MSLSTCLPTPFGFLLLFVNRCCFLFFSSADCKQVLFKPSPVLNPPLFKYLAKLGSIKPVPNLSLETGLMYIRKIVFL